MPSCGRSRGGSLVRLTLVGAFKGIGSRRPAVVKRCDDRLGSGRGGSGDGGREPGSAFLRPLGPAPTRIAMRHAFLCDALRTPFGRYGGALSGVRADDLAAVPIRALIQRHPGVDWARLDDVVY